MKRLRSPCMRLLLIHQVCNLRRPPGNNYILEVFLCQNFQYIWCFNINPIGWQFPDWNSRSGHFLHFHIIRLNIYQSSKVWVSRPVSVCSARYVCKWSHAVHHSWWRHQMETFSALLAICARNYFRRVFPHLRAAYSSKYQIASTRRRLNTDQTLSSWTDV